MNPRQMHFLDLLSVFKRSFSWVEIDPFSLLKMLACLNSKTKAKGSTIYTENLVPRPFLPSSLMSWTLPSNVSCSSSLKLSSDSPRGMCHVFLWNLIHFLCGICPAFTEHGKATSYLEVLPASPFLLGPATFRKSPHLPTCQLLLSLVFGSCF